MKSPPLKSCPVFLPESLLHAVHERAFGDRVFRDGASLIFAEEIKTRGYLIVLTPGINDMEIYH
jgi:hypothetical protein